MMLLKKNSSGNEVSCTFSDTLNSLYKLAVIFIAISYGWILASLPIDIFKDRANYLIYADQSFLIYSRYWSEGILTSFANEPVWLLINIGLRELFEPELVLRIIIGLPASVVAYLVLRTNANNFFWLLLLLFLPQVVKNHIIHLRQGMAVSFFLMAWFSKNRSIRYTLFFLAPLIHSSFFLILGLMGLTKILCGLRFSTELRNIVFIVFGIAFGITISSLATLLGARQALEYNFSAGDISGLGFVFWFLVLALLLCEPRSFIRQNAFIVGTLIFYLSTYFLIEITARIFESSLIILILTCMKMTGWRYQVFLPAIVCYGLISYLIRIGQPWLGFALT